MSILAIIIIITLWYQSSLTKPMRELSKTATSILKDKDYSVRANKVSKDEFGRLTDIFNEMLDSIEESNSLLRSANEEMEQRVERRTKELTLSNQRITEEMEAKELANEELNKTRQQLSQNEKFANVGQVSSSIAHELRNPLAAIRNSTYYLNLKVKDNKLTKHLKIIDKEISRSDDVIRRLLEITKGEDLKKESTDINFLAKEAMGYADVQNICKLKINFSPKPFKLEIDKLLFRQVLHNLFLNSIQAMPKGGVIELRVTQIKDNWAELIIIDSGQGIKEHLIDKIFEPLYTDKKDGIGLGLSLCKDLISRHGGSIHALSKLNHGTKIIIKIPIT
jgi:signal transduction histidine kinase